MTLRNRWKVWRTMIENEQEMLLYTQKRTGVKEIKFPVKLKILK